MNVVATAFYYQNLCLLPVSLRNYVAIRAMATSSNRRYQPSSLECIEDVEDYRAGGFHPVHLGDDFKDGRYHVIHKLGYGGFSTVWLTEDTRLHRLVSLKIITAEASKSECELRIHQHLENSPSTHIGRSHVASALDHFIIKGPNGSHTCLVSQLAGPSIAQLCSSLGQAAGSWRLKASLAQRYARHVAQALGYLHSLGVVHGGKQNVHEKARLSTNTSLRCDYLEHLGTAHWC